MDMFHFVNQLNSSQVLHLIKDENEGIQALVLAQLKPEMAGELLRKFDPALRQKIMVNMGNIKNIPVSFYKDVASRLSIKALEVANMKYVEADGLDNILAIIPALSGNEQEEYISEIAEQDLDLANEVRRFFVGFHELHKMPEKFIQTVLRDFDRDTLALALVNAPEEIQNSTLQRFPERMRMMLQSSIESKQEARSGEIERARESLVRHIMKELRQSGGRPS
jgi:flagellar motor switch protein FliG